MSRILYQGDAQITQEYKPNVHEAVDIVKNRYQIEKITAHSDGTVVFVQTGIPLELGATGNRSYGNFVKIKHPNGYTTLYAHLKEVYVKNGEFVPKGTPIGMMGQTGNAYGVHLHFEVRNQFDKRINPTPYLNADLPNTTENLRYQSYDNKKRMWLPEVTIGSSGYAGNFGNPMGGVYLDKYRMRVHDMVKGYWLPWVQDRNDYAGNLGNNIDGVQIENVMYRVHLLNGNWLPWVSKVDQTADGYAGIYGRSIDALEIK